MGYNVGIHFGNHFFGDGVLTVDHLEVVSVSVTGRHSGFVWSCTTCSPFYSHFGVVCITVTKKDFG